MNRKKLEKTTTTIQPQKTIQYDLIKILIVFLQRNSVELTMTD